MKIRKHKNNKTFRISFTTRTPDRTETHLNSDGTTRKVVVEGINSPIQRVFAIGSDQPSVLRAFLFGRDASHIRTTIFEARTPQPVSVLCPALWQGRLSIS